MMRKLVFAVLCVCAGLCMTLSASDGATALSVSSAEGEFAAAKAAAEAAFAPLVVVWGNASCDHCNALSSALASSSELAAWLQKHPVYFVEKHEPYGDEGEDNLAARDWVKSLGVKLNGYPYVGLCWKKSDGTVVKTAFVGRNGSMPVSKPRNDLAGQFVASLDKYLADYIGGGIPEPIPSTSGDAAFVTADTEEDRLEAVPSTDVVYVPLRRETTDTEAGNWLVVTQPNGSERALAVTWAQGQAEQYVAVRDFTYARGKKMLLTLKDTNGKTLASSSIWMVAEPSNSPTNPHWIGDYSSRELPYGEWTLDYETAREKLTTQGGSMIAMFSGVKWCPHCIGIDNSLFADRKFYSWAKKNKVLLVLFDQPRFNSAESCQYVGPRLLSYNNDFGASGASYLSRNGLKGDDSEVLAAMDRQWTLTQKWLAPETTAFRLSNPTIVLLDATGTKVSARMNKYELDDRSFPTTENLNRLNDLLLLEEADETECYRTVTPLELTVGETTETTLQINETRRFIALDGVTVGDFVKVTATDTAKKPRDVKVDLYVGSTVLASGTGRVVTSRALTADEVTALSIRISSFGDVCEYGGKTTIDVDVSAEAGDESLVKTVPVSQLSKTELKALNPMLYTRLSISLPLFEQLDGSSELCGSLSVSSSAANKITAKYAAEKTVTFAGSWQDINLSSGLATATLAAKDGSILSLSMDPSGFLSAKLVTVMGLSLSGSGSKTDPDGYAGTYTVTLVDEEASVGTASLAIKIANSGKASVSGVMSDGTSVSASAVISPNGDGTATLPVYKVTSKGTLSLALTVAENAAATWGTGVRADTVNALADCRQTWETSSAKVSFRVYGGYWKKGLTPIGICDEFGFDENLSLVAGSLLLADVKATASGFSFKKEALTALSFNKSTGVFSGKAKVAVDGVTVTGSIRGVLLPSWQDCHCGEEAAPAEIRPYGSGTLYYTTVEDGVKISRSVPVTLNAKEND